MLFENINQLLHTKYLPIETGYCKLPNGKMFIAVLTRMVGCKIRWLNLWLDNREIKDELQTTSKKLVSKKKMNSYVENEFQGKYIRDKLKSMSKFISEDPNKYLDISKLNEHGIHVFTCGYILASNGEIIDRTLQIVRNTEYGCEMRSYYWVNNCTESEAQYRLEQYITDIGNLADFIKMNTENYKKQYNKPDIICKFCFGDDVIKNGLRKSGQYWICKSCGHRFMNNNALPYMRYPYYIIAKAVKDHFYDKRTFSYIKKYMSTRLKQEPSNSTMHGWYKKFTDMS